MNINQAIAAIDSFQGNSLTGSISAIEKRLESMNVTAIRQLCNESRIDKHFMASALSIKKIAGQINVIIHAAGILLSLQSILEQGEEVQSVSLGAGNTGRDFDLETNFRVAEYKFMDWQGSADTIRENGLFKDFYELAEYETTKRRYLYVVGTDIPLKFLKGGRALTSVLSRRPKILAHINTKYPEVKRVCDYYALKRNEVKICDVAPFIGRAEIAKK